LNAAWANSQFFCDSWEEGFIKFSKLTIFHLKYCCFLMAENRKSVRILVAPLDWGLGHAARCIPIIGQLLENGCDVVLAADGAGARLLAREFPQLDIKKLDGYRVRYGKKHLFLNIFLQLPRIFTAVAKERKWLNELLTSEKFDIIISDNRPGLYNSKALCVYITHQLRIQSGISSWVDNQLQKLHTRYMKKFNKVWVPDAAGSNNLAGELSHPYKQMIPVEYLGLISRLTNTNITPKKYDVLCLLSGPEPQRTLLEAKFIQELKKITGTALLVRGLPGENKTLQIADHVTAEQHLSATDLETAIAQSSLVICRSGYTTLMDLMKLKKKAVLIPTPGQTEQEYLAAYMHACNYFPYMLQKEFNLENAMQLAATFSYHHPFETTQFEHYRDVVDDLVASVAKT
jgi:predicted glycosyltransferase